MKKKKGRLFFDMFTQNIDKIIFLKEILIKVRNKLNFTIQKFYIRNLIKSISYSPMITQKHIYII